MKLRILVADDDAGHRATLLTLLEDWKYAATGVGDGEAAVARCRETPFDLVLMDVRMPGLSGVDALKEIRRFNPAIPVLVMTAYSDVGDAVDALKSGACDYLSKPLDFEELKRTLERTAAHAAPRLAVNTGSDPLSCLPDGGIIGESPAMRYLLEMLGTVAPSEATVLITGESGTGKELVARMIHSRSRRGQGPYIAVNCAALTETLLESELFGHEKGAFTGAEKRRDGRFLAADKGTIFLDEIGEMPLPMQAKLLRAIQEREIQPVGGDRPVKVDVRILAATNRDLQEEVEQGRFRRDLYYRLNVVTLPLPALRERMEDIPLLATYFLERFAEKNGKRVSGFTPVVMDRLVKHHWPGNVRELENTVERAVVLLMGEFVSERELPPGLGGQDLTPFSGLAPHMTLEEIERAVVLQAVHTAGGNKSEAARRLGITRKTLAAKMQG